MRLQPACLILASLVISSSCFAQLSLKGEVLSAAHNWTGFYVGANLGAVNHSLDLTDVEATSFNATLHQVSNPKLTGGIQLGYRQQCDLSSASGVYGLEFSANFSDAQFNKQYGSPFALYQLRSTSSLKDVLLLEATGGIAANRTLVFLAAGLGWINVTGSTTNLDEVAFFNSFSVTKKRFAAAIGGGIEYAFTDALSARMKVDVVSPTSYTIYDNVGDSFQVASSIIQGTFGLNYKFA